MPAWDKEKQAQYYLENKDAMCIKRRRRYIEEKKLKQKREASEGVFNKRKKGILVNN